MSDSLVIEGLRGTHSSRNSSALRGFEKWGVGLTAIALVGAVFAPQSRWKWSCATVAGVMVSTMGLSRFLMSSKREVGQELAEFKKIAPTLKNSPDFLAALQRVPIALRRPEEINSYVSDPLRNDEQFLIDYPGFFSQELRHPRHFCGLIGEGLVSVKANFWERWLHAFPKELIQDRDAFDAFATETFAAWILANQNPEISSYPIESGLEGYEILSSIGDRYLNAYACPRYSGEWMAVARWGLHVLSMDLVGSYLEAGQVCIGKNKWETEKGDSFVILAVNQGLLIGVLSSVVNGCMIKHQGKGRASLEELKAELKEEQENLAVIQATKARLEQEIAEINQLLTSAGNGLQ